MAKQGPSLPLKSPTHATAAALVGHIASDITTTVVLRAHRIRKACEVKMLAYFPADVKASLRMIQGMRGHNLKDCLTEALCDLFRKHNLSVSIELGEGR